MRKKQKLVDSQLLRATTSIHRACRESRLRKEKEGLVVAVKPENQEGKTKKAGKDENDEKESRPLGLLGCAYGDASKKGTYGDASEYLLQDFLLDKFEFFQSIKEELKKKKADEAGGYSTKILSR